MTAFDVSVTRDPQSMARRFSATVDDMQWNSLRGEVAVLVLERIAEAIAAEYIKTHMQDVLAAIDPNAVANLAVADSAAAIRETVDVGVQQMHKDMGKLQREVGREREVLIPGWFRTKRGIVR